MTVENRIEYGSLRAGHEQAGLTQRGDVCGSVGKLRMHRFPGHAPHVLEYARVEVLRFSTRCESCKSTGPSGPASLRILVVTNG